jgi:hypothetical protein
MHSAFRRLSVFLAVGVVAAVTANQAAAQVYCPEPVVSYYAPPVVSYYAPPVVSYYAAPVVSYYAPPAVSYYQPAYVPTTVTTYRGILPWRRYTVATYGAPAYVAPAPVASYYAPRYAWR